MNIREIMDKLKAIEEDGEAETLAATTSPKNSVSATQYYAGADGRYDPNLADKDRISVRPRAIDPDDDAVGKYGAATPASSRTDAVQRPSGFSMAQLSQRPTTFTGTTSDDNPDWRLQRGRRELGLAKQIAPGLDFKTGISRSQIGDRQSGAHIGVSGENWSAYAHQPFKGERPASFNIQYNKKF